MNFGKGLVSFLPLKPQCCSIRTQIPQVRRLQNSATESYQKFAMPKIDLRSDTVSWPIPEMRHSMANAEVGDDVYGEDPTVKKLEKDSAQIFGKEDALFVTSGTQGNLLALLTHCVPGDKVIMGHNSHIFLFEKGGASAIGGIMPHILQNQQNGTLLKKDINQAMNDGSDCHCAPTKVVVIENTISGVPISAEYTDEIGSLVHENNMKLHIDGARIFNAATALRTDVKTLTKSADSVTFCLSKGLCAPVGSILLGSKEFINKAKFKRKILGGGMRQVGFLAAAGLVGLHNVSKRLHEDHENAQFFADGLRNFDEIDVVSNETNFVWFRVNEKSKISNEKLCLTLKENDVLISPYRSSGVFRAVFHYWITKEKVTKILQIIQKALKCE